MVRLITITGNLKPNPSKSHLGHSNSPLSFVNLLRNFQNECAFDITPIRVSRILWKSDNESF